MSIEKRNHFRVKPDKDHPVTVDVNGENFIDILPAHNISEGGIGIVVPHKFEGCKVDIPVSLTVSLPYPVDDSFTVSGKITHASRKIFGVIFIDLDQKDRCKIQKYIEYKIKSEPCLTRMKYKIRTMYAKFQ